VTTVALVGVGLTSPFLAGANDSAGAAKAHTPKSTKSPSPQVITFTSTPPSPAVVGGIYHVVVTGGGSGNPVTLSIAPAGTSGACSVTGTTVGLLTAGTCIVAANQAGNAAYAAAPQTEQSFTIAAAPHPGPGASTTSPSVMIQLSTFAQDYAPSQLQSWLNQICPSGVAPAGDLALQDIATSNGSLLTSYLNVLAPYLPGGSTHPCFAHVFVGTVEPSWTGGGSEYVEGVEDSSFVDSYVAQSAAVARSFVQQFPQVTEDWYATYEANLNELYYAPVLAGYERLLGGELNAFNAAAPGREVMWAPAFWYPYSVYSQNTVGMSGLSQSLTALFSALKPEGGLQMIDLTDYVSGSSCQPVSNQVTPADAVGWVRFLQAIPGAPRVVVNTEQYAMDCATQGVVDGNPQAVQSREAYYEFEGLTLGPAFELRYWISNHP
jgi:hypothetical protein